MSRAYLHSTVEGNKEELGVNVAVDGMWLSEVYGIGEIREEMRGKVVRK